MGAACQVGGMNPVVVVILVVLLLLFNRSLKFNYIKMHLQRLCSCFLKIYLVFDKNASVVFAFISTNRPNKTENFSAISVGIFLCFTH